VRSFHFPLREQASPVVDLGKPAIHTGSRERRCGDYLRMWIGGENVVSPLTQLEWNVCQKIAFVEHHDVRSAEHRQVLERLVDSFSGTCYQHPKLLAEIEKCGTHEVSHVFDEEHAA